jgi:DNA-binding protein HU-beta
MAVKPMTKGQILDHMANKTGVTKKLAGQYLEELVALAYKEAKKSFTLPGLGKLVVVNRKKRMGRNPATGATMVIPAKRVLKFRIAKAAKDNAL